MLEVKILPAITSTRGSGGNFHNPQDLRPVQSALSDLLTAAPGPPTVSYDGANLQTFQMSLLDLSLSTLYHQVSNPRILSTNLLQYTDANGKSMIAESKTNGSVEKKDLCEWLVSSCTVVGDKECSDIIVGLAQKPHFMVDDQLYTVEKSLGEGGNAVVFLIKNSIGNQFALKILKSSHNKDTASLTNEIALTKKSGEVEGSCLRDSVPMIMGHDKNYMVLSYVDGVPFDTYLIDRPFTLDDPNKIILKLEEILEKLHNNGVYHGDLNGENIFIGEDGKVTVIDFGLARFPASDEEGVLKLGGNGNLFTMLCPKTRDAYQLRDQFELLVLEFRLRAKAELRNPQCDQTAKIPMMCPRFLKSLRSLKQGIGLNPSFKFAIGPEHVKASLSEGSIYTSLSKDDKVILLSKFREHYRKEAEVLKRMLDPKITLPKNDKEIKSVWQHYLNQIYSAFPDLEGV